MTVGLWKDSNEKRGRALGTEGKNSSQGFEIRCLPLGWCDFGGMVVEILN